MKKFFAAFVSVLCISAFAAGELRLADATGGAQLNMMQAAIELSMEQKLDLFMRRLLPTAALQELDKGNIDAVIIDHRFVKNRPFVPLAAEALALYAATSNPAANLTTSQVREILLAYRPTWKKYNNLPMDIQRIMLKPLTASGTLVQRIFGSRIFDSEIFKVDSISSGFTFSNSASIFFAPYFPRYPLEIKCLSVDGVPPSGAAIIKGDYPLTLRYVIVFKNKNDALDMLIKKVSQEKYRSEMKNNGFFVLLPEITAED